MPEIISVVILLLVVISFETAFNCERKSCNSSRFFPLCITDLGISGDSSHKYNFVHIFSPFLSYIRTIKLFFCKKKTFCVCRTP